MEDLKALAEQLVNSCYDNTAENTEALEKLCSALGIEEKVDQFPNDWEWRWELTWRACEKLGVECTSPICHLYDHFRIEVRDTVAVSENGADKYYTRPVMTCDDYWEAREAFKKFEKDQNGVWQLARIIGIRNRIFIEETDSEVVLKTNKPAEFWKEPGEKYRQSLQNEKELLLYRIAQIDWILEGEPDDKSFPPDATECLRSIPPTKKERLRTLFSFRHDRQDTFQLTPNGRRLFYTIFHRKKSRRRS